MGTVRIREATRGDLNDLLDLLVALEDYHEALGAQRRDTSQARVNSRRDIEERLGNPGHCVFVAAEGNTLIGMASAESRRRRPWARPQGHIADVFVSPAHRGQAIGRALVAAVQSWLLAKGYDEIRVNVHPRNKDAQRFWKSLGWSAVAISMRKALRHGG